MAAFAYKLRSSPRARRRQGRSFVAAGKKPRLGAGGRFRALKAALKKRGAKNPEALASWIGRRRYGAQRFAKLSSSARRRT